MSHISSKAGIDRRAEQPHPTSSQYYQDRGCSPRSAATLAALTQQQLQLEASHLRQPQKRERD